MISLKLLPLHRFASRYPATRKTQTRFFIFFNLIVKWQIFLLFCNFCHVVRTTQKQATQQIRFPSRHITPVKKNDFFIFSVRDGKFVIFYLLPSHRRHGNVFCCYYLKDGKKKKQITSRTQKNSFFYNSSIPRAIFASSFK